MAPNSSTGWRFVLYVALVASCLSVGWAQDIGGGRTEAPNTRTNAHPRANSAPTGDQQKGNASDRAISQADPESNCERQVFL
jgi:hypothetical protein